MPETRTKLRLLPALLFVLSLVPAFALPQPGTVAAWGDNFYGQTTVPVGLRDVSAIAAGAGHTLAVRVDATVAAWGDNSFGQTNVPAGLGSVTAIAAGRFHTLALKADGTVVAWGGNANGQTTVPPGLIGVKAIAAGYYHSVALKSDGLVVAWGAGTSATGSAPHFGQSLVPASVNGVAAVTAIAASGFHTVAILSGVPTITTTISGNDFTLRWADTAAGYRLESSPSLSAPIPWNSEPGPFQTNAGRISHSLPLTAVPRFFRLAKP